MILALISGIIGLDIGLEIGLKIGLGVAIGIGLTIFIKDGSLNLFWPVPSRGRGHDPLKWQFSNWLGGWIKNPNDKLKNDKNVMTIGDIFTWAAQLTKERPKRFSAHARALYKAEGPAEPSKLKKLRWSAFDIAQQTQWKLTNYWQQQSTLKNVTPFTPYWDKEQQSKARNSDSRYRQMALVGFDT